MVPALGAVLALRAGDERGAALLLVDVAEADVDEVDRIIRLFIPGTPLSTVPDATVRRLLHKHLAATS